MLSKLDRLSVKEFDVVIKTGREAYSPFFTVKYALSSKFKFSPTAPKRTFETAVSRNRTRRRIYGAVRRVIASKRPKPNHVVLIIKKDISGITSQYLTNMINDLFVQARIIA